MLTLINTCHQTTLEYNKEPVSAYFPSHVYKLASTSGTGVSTYQKTLINHLFFHKLTEDSTRRTGEQKIL